MKTDPHLAVALTACAALAATFVLSTEDHALFEPRQAQLLVWADDVQSVVPRPAPFGNDGVFSVPQVVSPAGRVTRH
jgi:hypothetical protein